MLAGNAGLGEPASDMCSRLAGGQTQLSSKPFLDALLAPGPVQLVGRLWALLAYAHVPTQLCLK